MMSEDFLSESSSGMPLTLQCLLAFLIEKNKIIL